MNQQGEIDAAVTDFAVAARSHHQLTVDGAGARKINAQANLIALAYGRLRAHGEIGKQALARLLTDPDVAISIMAATYLMHYVPDASRAALKRALTDPGIIGLGAKYALKRFEDGSWSKEF